MASEDLCQKISSKVIRCYMKKRFFRKIARGDISHQPYMTQMSNWTFFYNTRCTTLHKYANKCLISAPVFSGCSVKKRQKFVLGAIFFADTVTLLCQWSDIISDFEDIESMKRPLAFNFIAATAQKVWSFDNLGQCLMHLYCLYFCPFYI